MIREIAILSLPGAKSWGAIHVAGSSNGYAEASRVPPEWHGWLHNTVATPPTEEVYEARSWQLPHRQNYTGTPKAYHPKGSILGGGVRPKATGDYEAWKP